MKSKSILILVSICLLSGCVSTYKGKGPDFSLKGNEAKREIEKFSLNTAYLEHGRGFYEMGPKNDLYSIPSLQPIIDEVSPRASQQLKGIGKSDKANLLAAGAMIAVALSPSSPSLQVPFYSFFALAIGTSIYSNLIVGEAAEQFNRDLREKFLPKISFSIPF